MSLWRFIGRLFSTGSRHRPQEKEPRYDNVQIKNVADGTTIQGHDAVKAYFEREKEMYETYGSSIIFQVYRVDLQASTIKDLQGQKLAQITVDGGFVSGNDTVAAVKEKVRALLEEKAQLQRQTEAQFDLTIEDTDRMTLYFNGRPMQDDTAFYADNFVLLPAWVQVLLHRCEFEEVARLAAKLKDGSQGKSDAGAG
jgi:hypothetical protein